MLEEKKLKLGKKFTFATIAIICASITAIICKYSGEVYFKTVTAIVGIFTLMQGITDVGRKKDE